MSTQLQAEQQLADGYEEGGGFAELLERFGIKSMPAWGASLGVHLLLLLTMAGVKFHLDIKEESAVVTSVEDVERQVEFDTTLNDQVGTTADATTLVATSTSAVAMTTAPGATAQANVDNQLKEEMKVDVYVGEESFKPGQGEILASVEVKGQSTELTAGGVEGAIDRLAMELANSLRERRTTVIWLFDASLSLEKRRNSIADRFENVYKQLDSLDIVKDNALQTAVATYGEKTNIITPEPVDDVRSVIPKVRSIPNDESGKENVFTALNLIHGRFQKYRNATGGRRNMLVFIVTDERGDDFGKQGEVMEEVIQLYRRTGIKVFVVGNAAPFGKEKGFVSYTYTDGNKETIEIPVDQGPETIMPETLNLGFWGNRGPALDKLSSGYGPYALTRLCKETGGLYFVAEEGGLTTIKFNPAIMRNYSPDYSAIRTYELGLQKNKAKAALVTAATKTAVENIRLPQLLFEHTSDNVLREQITEAQKPAAELDYRLNEMLTILTTGEKDRDKITEPRWRAAYDLAMGRALAMRVRIYGYNKLLAEMKGAPKTFTKKGSNEWRLVPSKNITAGADVKKLEQQAQKYLKRVMDEHPETPWALLAEKEYTQNMGWDWQEATGNYPMAGLTPEEKKKRILLAADEEKKKKAVQKQAPPPRAVPKL